jgi:chromate reductase
MTAPEGYINFRPVLFTDDGEVTDQSTAAFLTDFMQEFRIHTERVLTVIPRHDVD